MRSEELEELAGMDEGPYEREGRRIGRLVDRKNRLYGDSFHRSGEVLKILFPDGVEPEQYRDMLALVRIIDKQFRVARGGWREGGEENPFGDIAGYGILGSRD